MYFPQIPFLRLVEEALPSGYLLHQYLMDELELSRSAAFRRINGESEVKASEIAHLINQFPQALEKLFAQPRNLGDYALSQTSQFANEEELWAYLDRLRALFRRAAEQEATLYYTALDYPLFSFLQEPDLLYYKYAFWTNRIVEEGIRPLRPNTLRLAQEVCALYGQTHSIEIWSARMELRQEEQIKALGDLELLSAYQIDRISKAIHEVRSRLRKDLKAERKPSGRSFQVYRAPYSTLCNGGVLVFPKGESIYMGAFSTAQFLRSCSQQVVTKFLKDFNLIKDFSERMVV